ncbi:MAG: N-acetylneuraminate synthase family protein [Flavobacteriales bacterium]
MFVISEISPQHHGDHHIAEQMILQSKLGGAEAVKVQLYDPEQFNKPESHAMSKEQLRDLRDFGDAHGIPVFATAFAPKFLDWCVDLDLKYMKVAARMHVGFPELTRDVMQVGKPTFVSIPSDMPQADVDNIALEDHATYLYCVVKYPTLVEEFRMPDFATTRFSGISDHTLGNSAAMFASAHGAMYLEKHFTLRKSFQRTGELAHLCSMDLQDLMEIRNTASEFELLRKATGVAG